MPKEEAIEVMATVVEPLPNAMFKVTLQDEKRSSLTVHLGTQTLLRLTPGDEVFVELSPYDPTRGRVVRKVS